MPRMGSVSVGGGESRGKGSGGGSGNESLCGAERVRDDVNYLYTNRGLATHPPLRFNCSPELTIIELVPC